MALMPDMDDILPGQADAIASNADYSCPHCGGALTVNAKAAETPSRGPSVDEDGRPYSKAGEVGFKDAAANERLRSLTRSGRGAL